MGAHRKVAYGNAGFRPLFLERAGGTPAFPWQINLISKRISLEVYKII
jgi:hypothetical protein